MLACTATMYSDTSPREVTSAVRTSGYTEVLEISPYHDATFNAPLRLPFRCDGPIFTANDRKAVAMLLASRNPKDVGAVAT